MIHSNAKFSIALPNRRATTHLGRTLARELRGGDLVILNGELGAGKTFLVRALCRGLGLPESHAVTSPTFPLRIELPTAPPIVHADLYRLERAEEAEQLGLDEARDEGHILLVEWGNRFAQALGGDALHLTIDLDPRRAILRSEGPRSAALLHDVVQRARESKLTTQEVEPPSEGEV